MDLFFLFFLPWSIQRRFTEQFSIHITFMHFILDIWTFLSQTCTYNLWAIIVSVIVCHDCLLTEAIHSIGETTHIYCKGLWMQHDDLTLLYPSTDETVFMLVFGVDLMNCVYCHSLLTLLLPLHVHRLSVHLYSDLRHFFSYGWYP